MCTLAAGSDYLPREMRLTFSPGEFEKRVSIQLIDNRIPEDREVFYVSLHSPVSRLMVELPPNSVIFIIDDDTGMGLVFIILDVIFCYLPHSGGSS